MEQKVDDWRKDMTHKEGANLADDNTIQRIQRMEHCLDEVLKVMHTCPDSIYEEASIQKMIQELTDYYENGQWLQDYDSDARDEFPADLKRGVLSQDTLYDLLCEIEHAEIGRKLTEHI